MAIDAPLALPGDQRALRAPLHGFLAARRPPAALRAMLETEAGYSPDLHARLAGELGLAGLAVPEEFGGLGLSQAEASVVHTELGYALYPGPYLSSALAASAVIAAGDRAAAARWLPLLADGSVTGTVATADKDGLWSPATGRVRAHPTPHGWRLYGRCWYVIAAHVAGIVVVSAMAGSAPAMFLVEGGAQGLKVSGLPGMDLTRRGSAPPLHPPPAPPPRQGGAPPPPPRP